jgi:hypothetical protein
VLLAEAVGDALAAALGALAALLTEDAATLDDAFPASVFSAMKPNATTAATPPAAA